LEFVRWITDETILYGFTRELPTTLLLVLIAFCALLLSKGADWMVDGAVALARLTGLSKIVIGATIVSLGTTAPEAFVSVMAAWMGNSGLALGNGVGSIIADTGLIFGLTCVIAAPSVNHFILNRTGLVQVAVATLLVFISVLAWISVPEKPVLGRWTGVFFLVLLAGYMYATCTWARQRDDTCECLDESDDFTGYRKCWIMVIGGLVLIAAGARLIVPCAAEVAYRLGVPEDIVAATMVALGTSLPELITAITSVRKGHPEITVGNIVGADVLNCLFVIGAAAVAKPLVVSPNFFIFHFPAMLFILYSFRFFIIMNRDGRFKKWQGMWLLGIYVVYVVLQYALGIGTV
jgi:cation:H+ antiporter